MRLQVGIDETRLIQALVGEPLEQVDHAARRLVRGVEELDAGMVGLVLLRAHVSEQRALDRRLRRHDRRSDDLAAAGAGARAGHRRADAGQQGNDRGGLRPRKLLAQAHEMTAGKVAGLVRQHADHLVRRLGVEQRAGVDEDVAPVHDEGVEGAVVEHDHLDVLLGDAGGAQDRRRVVAQQVLDLGVADDRQAAALRVHRGRSRADAGDADGDRHGHRDRPHRRRHWPRPR